VRDERGNIAVLLLFDPKVLQGKRAEKRKKEEREVVSKSKRGGRE